MRKTYAYLTSILFVVVLLIPMVQTLTHIFPVSRVEGENRNLAPRPAFTLKNLKSYPTKFDNYFNDNFPLRALFVDAFFDYSIRTHQSPISSVVIGKNNFLFCGKEEKELFIGSLDFPEKAMDSIVSMLKHRYHQLKRQGIRFYVTIAPTAWEVYPEYIPAKYQRTQQTVTELFCIKMQKKAPEIPVIYLKNTLLDHKKKGQLYYRFDNHWNELGALYGAQNIMQRLSKDFPTLRSFNLEHFKLEPYQDDSTGNLLGWLTTSKKKHYFSPDTRYHVSFSHPTISVKKDINYPPTEGFAYPRDYAHRYVSSQKDAPKILVIRDSYSNALIPYFTPYFNTSTFIFDAWLYGENLNIITQEKPNIVLLEIYEPHIRNIAMGNRR